MKATRSIWNYEMTRPLTYCAWIAAILSLFFCASAPFQKDISPWVWIAIGVGCSLVLAFMIVGILLLPKRPNTWLNAGLNIATCYIPLIVAFSGIAAGLFVYWHNEFLEQSLLVLNWILIPLGTLLIGFVSYGWYCYYSKLDNKSSVAL